MDESQWHYAVGQQQHGPVTREQLEAMARSGQLHPGQLVWSPGMGNWAPAGTVPGLFAVVTVPLAYAVYDPTQAILRNGRINCVVLFSLFCFCAAALGGYFAWRAQARYPEDSPMIMLSVFTMFLLPAGAIFAAIYLPVRWRYIRQLSPRLRRLGVIGGVGLATMLIGMIVYQWLG